MEKMVAFQRFDLLSSNQLVAANGTIIFVSAIKFVKFVRNRFDLSLGQTSSSLYIFRRGYFSDDHLNKGQMNESSLHVSDV